eukprot:113552-Rhodomonas_salina.3
MPDALLHCLGVIVGSRDHTAHVVRNLDLVDGRAISRHPFLECVCLDAALLVPLHDVPKCNDPLPAAAYDAAAKRQESRAGQVMIEFHQRRCLVAEEGVENVNDVVCRDSSDHARVERHGQVEHHSSGTESGCESFVLDFVSVLQPHPFLAFLARNVLEHVDCQPVVLEDFGELVKDEAKFDEPQRAEQLPAFVHHPPARRMIADLAQPTRLVVCDDSLVEPTGGAFPNPLQVQGNHPL